MKVTESGGNSKEYALTPVGTFPARCIRVVDLGTHEKEWKGEVKKSRKVMVTWEISELMPEEDGGKPWVIQAEYTASISEKAKLGQLLNKWRGKPFTEEEKKGFNLFNLLGVPCMLSVEHNTARSGRIYANVGGCLPLPKAMQAIDQVNESFSFDIEEMEDADKLKSLWGLERYLIERSDEFVASGLSMPPKEEKKENSEEQAGEVEDEIPF
jgi:hypothetical protein